MRITDFLIPIRGRFFQFGDAFVGEAEQLGVCARAVPRTHAQVLVQGYIGWRTQFAHVLLPPDDRDKRKILTCFCEIMLLSIVFRCVVPTCGYAREKVTGSPPRTIVENAY